MLSGVAVAGLLLQQVNSFTDLHMGGWMHFCSQYDCTIQLCCYEYEITYRPSPTHLVTNCVSVHTVHVFCRKF